MKRCSIVFHSVCGNCYLIATAFHDALRAEGVDARLYHVDDDDLHIWANKFEVANDYYEEITNLPVANAEKMLKSDMIILGSPTYFGNVSAEMKQLMDSSSIYFNDGSLSGKYFACFTSGSYVEGGGVLAIQAMIHYAQHMGMIHIPVGKQVHHIDPQQPDSGIMHHSGPESEVRPSDRLEKAIVFYAKLLAKELQEEPREH